ncbi:hypothetical protein [Bradyrhizobium sp.]|jgi:hypothetical protein|uniref:hypothetical protein n=1 Tax=Bradyrhizobium sp. TaxID=376 RepID=UPI003C3C675C
MKSRMYGILIASVGAIALTGATSETFAASRGAHMTSHRFAPHSLRHHHRSQDGFVWGDGGYFYGPTADAPLYGAPLTGEIRNSNASDIPWDWAHRYPPAVVPSARPYVSSCGAETVTVPDGRGGNGQVNIVRCY